MQHLHLTKSRRPDLGEKPMTTTPYITLLLDRSGSMASSRADAVAAVNGYLATAADDPVLTGGRLSLITFDSESIDVVREGVPIATAAPLGEGEFVPRGLTPLLDAVAVAVAHLDRQPGRSDDPRVLAIVTDGGENASVKHTRASIRSLLEARQAAGWLVLYLGANQDSWGEAHRLGIDRASVADYDVDRPRGVAAALTGATKRFVDTGTKGFVESERQNLRKP
jgi:Mg-chelatase subunit ChlD